MSSCAAYHTILHYLLRSVSQNTYGIHGLVSYAITFTTLWTNSAIDKLLYFSYLPENMIWHSMQIVSIGDNLHEMSNPIYREKLYIKKRKRKKKKKKSKWRLLKILLRLLCINLKRHEIVFVYVKKITKIRLRIYPCQIVCFFSVFEKLFERLTLTGDAVGHIQQPTNWWQFS